VTYTILVSGNGPTPTGSVTVSDGQGGTCSAALSTGLANCAINEANLTSPFTVTATYGGDQNYGSAAASLTNARGESDSPTGTALATLGPTSASATGVGTVNVLQYQSNPVGTPNYTSTGVYFDVAASAGNSFSSEVIQDCDLNGGSSLLWWNPAANAGAGGWQSVVGDPGPTYTAGPPACISATLDSTTSPSLSQLTGTVFGIGIGLAAPGITSAATAKVVSGSHVNLTVTTSGNPAPSLSETGAFPSGISFTDNHNGTATISGTLVAKKTGTYTLNLTATNSQGSAHQTLMLTVAKPVKPKFVSGKKLTFVVGENVADTIATTGWPVPTLSQTGTLPPGITFTLTGNGDATLTGLPSKAGSYSATVTASSSAGSASQVLKIKVDS